MISEQDIRQLIIHGTGAEGRAALQHFRSSSHIDILLVDQPEKLSEFRTDDGSSAKIQCISEDDVRSSSLPDPATCLYLRSPGVQPANPVFEGIRAAGIAHTTPTGYWLATEAPAETVTVTGTKGKSTTVSLTANLLRWAGRPAEEVGNIGRPPLGTSFEQDTICVAELSSYMMHDLPLTGHFHAVTSLYKEHTTWHGSFESYRSDKLRPFVERPATPGVLPKALQNLLPEEHNAATFEEIAPIADTVIELPDWMQIEPAGLHPAFSAPSMLLALRAALVITISAKLLTPAQAAEAATSNLGTWQGLASRQSIIPSTDGIIWVDDALATVPEATLSALSRWRERGIQLLLGGDDRGQHFSELAQAVRDMKNVRIHVFSKTAENVLAAATAAGIADRITPHQTLEDMISTAASLARAGEVILFSPAAPSAPPHHDYTERSTIFKSFVPQG